MLYSIGYEKLTVPQLIDILKERQITHLIDIRTYPSSDKKGFNKNELRKEINSHDIEYSWQGDALGGRGSEITTAVLKNLVSVVSDLNACLICYEHNPKGCHRYVEIGARLEKVDFFVEVQHLIPVHDTDGNYLRCKSILTGSQNTLF